MKKGVREIEKRLLQPVGESDRLGALLDLGAHHAALGHERDGLRAARDALHLAQDIHDPLAAARALALAARCHFQRGDYFAAIASGIDALAGPVEDDGSPRAEVARMVALALRELEDYPHAESAAVEAVRLAAGQAEPEALAREALGIVLAARGRSHAARQELRRAGALFRGLGDRVGLKRITSEVAHTYRNQANAAQRDGLGQQARLQWRHAARVYRAALAFGDRAEHDGTILAAIAECELGLGELDAAYEHAERAVMIAEEAVRPGTVGRARLWQSHALHGMSRLQAAERACAQAVASAEAARDEPLLVTCLRAHSRLCDLLGRFESGADSEDRARRIENQRGALLARMRAELLPVLRREPGADAGGVPINSDA